MKPQWKVYVESIKESIVELSVIQIDPEAGNFPVSKLFALRLIYETATKYNEESSAHVPTSPLGHAITFSHTLNDHHLYDEAPKFITEIIVDDLFNSPFISEELADSINHLLVKRGYIEDEPGWDEAFQEEWDRFWETEKLLPQAHYTIQLSDSKWLKHLKEGQSFQTNAFCLKGPFYQIKKESNE